MITLPVTIPSLSAQMLFLFLLFFPGKTPPRWQSETWTFSERTAGNKVTACPWSEPQNLEPNGPTWPFFSVKDLLGVKPHGQGSADKPRSADQRLVLNTIPGFQLAAWIL